MEAIRKDRIFWKSLLKNKEMVLGNGVKNIQAVAYNGTRTVVWPTAEETPQPKYLTLKYQKVASSKLVYYSIDPPHETEKFFDWKNVYTFLIPKTLQPAIRIVLSHHPIRPNPQFPKTNSTSQNLGIITKISGWSLILKSSFHGDDKNERKKKID